MCQPGAAFTWEAASAAGTNVNGVDEGRSALTVRNLQESFTPYQQYH